MALLFAACGADDDAADDSVTSTTAPDDVAQTAEAEESDSDDGEATGVDAVPDEEPEVVEQAADLPIVLVHGAWQDGTAWARVQQVLEDGGRRVSAVSLPGRDGTDAGAQTLVGYRDVVISEIEKYDGPVILVGHSFGGMTISGVAEAIPADVAHLVYLAAYLPADGDSLAGLADADQGSLLSEEGNLLLEGEPLLATVPTELFAGIFCPDCDPADPDLVTASAVAEPAGPLLETVTLTEANFGSIAKTYIQTALDVVIGPDLQSAMAAEAGITDPIVIQAGHAPYISAADDVADLIGQLAANPS
ncbi:MAG: alpha/beta fold hydrolase [Actinomycetota bacterium]